MLQSKMLARLNSCYVIKIKKFMDSISMLSLYSNLCGDIDGVFANGGKESERN